MLVKALLPLHSARSIIAFHPQLSYCMALFVAKDHALTRQVVPGLLRFWPFGNSQKQIMFLNELEDIFEYVQVRFPRSCVVHAHAEHSHWSMSRTRIVT